ncbi:uncharacterized protein DEA37_0003277 [Paragonimus westermani]|uniref:Amino acid transporter transmembrane domain-containing protein n=1 Tax=Paragonimus westermani TaxID=34504 RepID=A0A5J4N662_9TREM|nr:uncharacterized protein DEA37_0007334 [Paragonimus westermani]KAA3670993.1 uncharacterized protein DEA37_0003277 [Paragonimus westermani]
MGVLTSVITLISSTVGVAVLAMPYCFQQCGILLSIIFIALCAFTCSSACDILITLCLTHRSLSLEKACFRHLGLLGKLVAQLCVPDINMVSCSYLGCPPPRDMSFRLPHLVNRVHPLSQSCDSPIFWSSLVDTCNKCALRIGRTPSPELKA